MTTKSNTRSHRCSWMIGFLSLAVTDVESWSHVSRRQWWNSVLRTATSASLLWTDPISTPALEELPMGIRSFTKLAPLGKPEKSLKKSYNLPLEELRDRLTHDLLEGYSGQGGYFFTGDISDDIFRDDCIFVDPTNRVSSLSQYRKALGILFDPKRSKIQIIEPLTVDSDKGEIRGKIRARGFLQFPWNPYTKAYESNIVYRIGDEDGLVYEQEQAWTKSASEALQESFTPSIFSPPPTSTIPAKQDEPHEVTALFDYVNGRRPHEYSQEERFEIARLIDAIAAKRVPTNARHLSGKWMLVYLQPGPDGAGIDRRIPFPEFSFNGNYQVFTYDSVTNIGELFGPSLFVQVFGNLGQEDDINETPKRFRVNIRGGKLCIVDDSKCLKLPIEGEGLFDSVFLGDRLRIGQNLNGGGARVVQVRLD